MISMHLQQAASSMQGYLYGQDAIFSGCSTDTRSLRKNELFVALRGENFDGHRFVDQAFASGACGVVVEQQVDEQAPAIVVKNSRKALSDLAHYWRQQFGIPLVAVTGSNGKTTVKEMISHILRQSGEVLSTQGNLNNDIGVPLTLFRLQPGHQYAVIEMGANHAGEIDLLSHTAKPDVAVITQCAPAHLEGFGSIEGVARAKAEIFHGLSDNGVAVVNADDDYAGFWLEETRQFRQITFAQQTAATVSATGQTLDSTSGCYSFDLNIDTESLPVSLQCVGRHNVQNSLAAAACAFALDIKPETIQQGLHTFTGVPGRLQQLAGLKNTRILDDTYNANPGSLRAAISVLCSFSGEHWLVLGDMGELGSGGQQIHAEMGELARQAGISKLFAIGELAQAAVEAFGRGAEHHPDHASLLQSLKSGLDEQVTVLVKGSRTMQMEKVVNELVEVSR